MSKRCYSIPMVSKRGCLKVAGVASASMPSVSTGTFPVADLIC